MIKWKNMGWAWYVAGMDKKGDMLTLFWWGNLEERSTWESEVKI